MKSQSYLLILISLSAHSVLAAPEVLTIRTAVERALNSNPNILNAREKMSEGKSLHSAGISRLFPSVDVHLSSERRKDSVLTGLAAFNGERYNQYEAGLQLVQPIYTGELWAGLRAAASEKEVRELDLKIAERDTTVQVISAFYSVLMNQENLKTLKEARKVDDQSLGVARKRASIGRSQRLDVLQIQTQIALLDSRIAQAEADLKTSVVGLMLLFADRETSVVDLKGSLKVKGLKEFLAPLKSQPYEIYEFTRIGALRDEVRDKNNIVLAKYWPRFNFVANYGRISNTRADLTNDYANAWSYGLELKIPIFSGLSSIAEGNAYASQLRQMEIQEGQLKDSAAYAETKAIHDLQAAEKMIEISENALDLSQQSVNEAQRNFRFSTIDYFQFQSIQQSSLDARVSYQAAQYTYITSMAKYLVATGHPVGDLVKVLEK